MRNGHVRLTSNPPVNIIVVILLNTNISVLFARWQRLHYYNVKVNDSNCL